MNLALTFWIAMIFVVIFIFHQMRSFLIVLLLSIALVAAWNPQRTIIRALKHIGASVLAVQVAHADAIPAVGTRAPDFTLPSNAGKSISLEDLKGKRTVLYFYPGDFTQGCTLEAQAFERDIAQYKKLSVQVVGVSVDSVDKHLDFGKKYGLDFPLLSDQGGAVSNKYGSLLDLGFIGKFSNRQTYIIGPSGNLEYVFTDVDSRVMQHSADVLVKLAELSAKS